MKIKISLINNQANGILENKLMKVIVLVLVFLGISISPVTALDNVADQDGQTELTPGPISTLVEDQFLPRAAYASVVNEYLVVWEDVVRDFDHDIFVIRVNDQGVPIGSEIYVGISANMDTHPGIAYSPMVNEYLVVWENEYSTTDHDILAQRIDAYTGSLVGGQISVAFSSQYDEKPVVTYDPYTQEYLVIYERRMGSDEFHQQDLYARRVSEDGTPIGDDLGIAIATSGVDEQNASVACDSVNYLVVWQGDYSNETNIYGQRIGADGSLIGGQIGIATWELDQFVPRLTYNSADAHYFVVWEDHHFSPYEIYGQRLDTNGNFVGNQVGISLGGNNNRTDADVAYLPGARSYLVVWQFEYSTSDHDIYGRRVVYDGSLPENEYIITGSTPEEKLPVVASNGVNESLVVWEDARNYDSSGVDIYGSVETINIPVFSGVVYKGDFGYTADPLPGVMVQLGCSSDQGNFGELIGVTETTIQGEYQLPAVINCEFYNIVEVDPEGYYSIGAQSVDGTVFNSNWIYYSLPLAGKVLSDNLFWDKVQGSGDDTPPGNWANFQPPDWVNVQTVPVSEQVEDTQSGLDVSTAEYQYSIDGGASWSGWLPAMITGENGTTVPQVISANVPFGRDSGPQSQNLVQFRVADMSGNLGEGPLHAVKIDSVVTLNPTSISSTTHTPNVWSNNQYISIQWSGASDERSGIYGYSTSFDQTPNTIPDIYRDTADPYLTNYAYVDSSSWWFHVRTLDFAGNAAVGAVHYGPFLIDTEPPLAWFTSQGGQVNVPTITVSWAGGDTLSGVYSYDVQTNTDGGGWTDWQVNNPALSASFTGLNGQTVSFRVRAHDNAGNISDWSSTITVAFGVTVTVNVRNESGLNLLHAKVYHNDQYIGFTDSNGNITIPGTMLGDSLTALMMVYVEEAGKPDHMRDGATNWGWRVYITNIKIPNDGTPQLFQVTDTNVTQQLMVRKDQALIGVHVIVVVGWDASPTFLEDLRQGLQSASAFLYDITDGQFFYETVEIFDDGENGPANDMYIYTDNTVWPNAFIAAITQKTGRMMFPPVFGGPWSNKHAFRTMIHEFGHYGLWLYDEYLKRNGSGGGFCTFNRNTATEETRASIMDNSDNASELCSRADPNHLHNPDTAQDAENNGESTWETVIRVYSDTQNPSRWTLQSPDTRQVAVVPGPATMPSSGWMNVYVDDNDTNVCDPFQAKATYANNTSAGSADVMVYSWPGTPLVQGKTNNSGEITVRGAHNGDTLNATKGNESGSIIISCTPSGLGGQSQESMPTVIIKPVPFKISMYYQYVHMGNDTLGVQVESSVILPNSPKVQIWQASAAQPILVDLSYDSGLGLYTGQFTLNSALDPKGYGLVEATDAQGNILDKIFPFAIDIIKLDLLTWLESYNGRMEILLPAGSVTGNPMAIVQPAPEVNFQQGSLFIIGDPYNVTLATGENMLQLPATLNLFYSVEGQQLMQYQPLGLYRWDAANEVWVLISTDIDVEHHMISAQITQLGTFAILAPPLYFIRMPLVIR